MTCLPTCNLSHPHSLKRKYGSSGWVRSPASLKRKRIIDLYWDWKFGRNPTYKISNDDAREIYDMDRIFGLDHRNFREEV